METPLLLINDGETDTLVPSNPLQTRKQRARSFSDSWKWYHTVTVLCIRLIIDFVFKNPLIFYLNYENGLSITYMEFAYVLIASECGCICAMFISDINKKYFKSDQRIMEIYLFICGFAQILFPVFAYFNINAQNELYNIIWCCIMRFIVGISFAFISAASIKFASEYVSNPNKITSIISILHYSWPLSTLLNIIAGYLILESWMLVFVISGVMLIVVSFFSMLMFHCFKLEHIPTTKTDAIIESEDTRNGMRVLFTDMNSLIIVFVSFFMTLRSRTIYIVTSSLWMEGVYGLPADLVGWTTLTVVLGEVLGLSIMSSISDKFELWISAVGTLTHQLVFGAMLFILTAIYGNNMALSVALILIVLLTMGHESFYVVQQSNAIHYAPLPRLKFLLLLGERTAQETASVLALLFTVWLWNGFGANSMLLFSLIWIALTFAETCILWIYKSEPTIKKSYT